MFKNKDQVHKQQPTTNHQHYKEDEGLIGSVEYFNGIGFCQFSDLLIDLCIE